MYCCASIQHILEECSFIALSKILHSVICIQTTVISLLHCIFSKYFIFSTYNLKDISQTAESKCFLSLLHAVLVKYSTTGRLLCVEVNVCG